MLSFFFLSFFLKKNFYLFSRNAFVKYGPKIFEECRMIVIIEYKYRSEGWWKRFTCFSPRLAQFLMILHCNIDNATGYQQLTFSETQVQMVMFRYKHISFVKFLKWNLELDCNNCTFLIKVERYTVDKSKPKSK